MTTPPYVTALELILNTNAGPMLLDMETAILWAARLADEWLS